MAFPEFAPGAPDKSFYFNGFVTKIARPSNKPEWGFKNLLRRGARRLPSDLGPRIVRESRSLEFHENAADNPLWRTHDEQLVVNRASLARIAEQIP
jgi:hypothetical protein